MPYLIQIEKLIAKKRNCRDIVTTIFLDMEFGALPGAFFVDREKEVKGGFLPDLARVSRGSSVS
tara:strand:+ start:24488 stop:24679 length:192 start_codon:yes stop_codon:yes gene_type:complete